MGSLARRLQQASAAGEESQKMFRRHNKLLDGSVALSATAMDRQLFASHCSFGDRAGRLRLAAFA